MNRLVSDKDDRAACLTERDQSAQRVHRDVLREGDNNCSVRTCADAQTAVVCNRRAAEAVIIQHGVEIVVLQQGAAERLESGVQPVRGRTFVSGLGAVRTIGIMQCLHGGDGIKHRNLPRFVHVFKQCIEASDVQIQLFGIGTRQIVLRIDDIVIRRAEQARQ